MKTNDNGTRFSDGDIIFLTRRDWKWYQIWDYRGLLSWAISKLTGSDYVHTANIYLNGRKVAEMEKEGIRRTDFEEYERMYRDRMVIAINPLVKENQQGYNNLIKNSRVKYDYKNLLFFQLIKLIFKKFIGKDTKNKNICSEFTARTINLLIGNKYFKDPEQVSPADIWKRIEDDWKKIYIHKENGQ